MIPGCTHELDIELDDHTVDLSQASNVYVTLAQGSTSKTFTGERVVVAASGYELTVGMTQEETLAFRRGNAKGQVNWLVSDGNDGYSRAATEPFPIMWSEQLLREVLPQT